VINRWKTLKQVPATTRESESDIIRNYLNSPVIVHSLSTLCPLSLHSSYGEHCMMGHETCQINIRFLRYWTLSKFASYAKTKIAPGRSLHLHRSSGCACPSGKYKVLVLCDYPVSNLEWLAQKGFPPGQSGVLS